MTIWRGHFYCSRSDIAVSQNYLVFYTAFIHSAIIS
jgi:hypothetical protein